MTLQEIMRTLPQAARIDAIYPYTDPRYGEGTMLLLANGLTREVPSATVTLVLRAYAAREDIDYRALASAWRARLGAATPPLPISLELTLAPLRYRRPSRAHQCCYAYINASHAHLVAPGSARELATIEFSSSARLTLAVSRSIASARLDQARNIFFYHLCTTEQRLLAAKREFSHSRYAIYAPSSGSATLSTPATHALGPNVSTPVGEEAAL